MKVPVMTYILMTLLLLEFSFGINSSNEDIKDYLENFLIIKNTQKYCEKDHLLMARETKNLFNLNKLLDVCESEKKCDFISYSPRRQLRNSIHYENDKHLTVPGANWVCSGDDWVISRPRKYWVTAVKKANIQNQMQFYDLSLNMAGACDEEYIIMKTPKVMTPSEASQECDRVPGCRYIIFNYSNFIGKEDVAEGRVILCSNIPLGRLNKLGFFLAGKRMTPLHTAKTEAEQKEISLEQPKGGPVTPDEHYKDFSKGDVVMTENI